MDWPVMGNNPDGDGCGQAFLEHSKPGLPLQTQRIPVVGAEFDGASLPLAWQWQAQPYPGCYSLRQDTGTLRLRAIYPHQQRQNLRTVPKLLLHKLPAPSFGESAMMTREQCLRLISKRLKDDGSTTRWRCSWKTKSYWRTRMDRL